jgi:hypothetical protein
MIMFREQQTPVQVATETCGFITIVGGTFLLHTTRDMHVSVSELASLSRDQGTSSSGSGGAGGPGGRELAAMYQGVPSAEEGKSGSSSSLARFQAAKRGGGVV